jgi:hypothetical protein
MATAYKIKSAIAHQYSTEPVRYATNLTYQVYDAVTSNVTFNVWEQGVITGTTSGTSTAWAASGSISTSCLVTDSREATAAEIRSHLDTVVGV